MISFLLALGIGFGQINQENLPVQQVEATARAVIEELKNELPNSPTLIIRNRPEPTPLGALNYSNGKCAVLINVNPQAWAQWGRFLNEQNRAQWENIIKTSVAHELGHCVPQAKQFAKGSLTPQDHLHSLGGHPEHSNANEEIFRQELFADTVAAIYARQTGKSEALSEIINARARFGGSDPTHDTSKHLNRYAELPNLVESGESWVSATVRLLSTETP